MATNNFRFKLPNLKEFMEVNPLTVSPETSVFEAIALMSQPREVTLGYGVTETSTCSQERSSHTKEELRSTVCISRSSYILAVDSSSLLGVLTERDIVKLTASNVDLKTTTVREMMSKNVISLKQADFTDIYQVISILRQNKIRHLPIVEQSGKLRGIVTSEGITRALNPTNLLKLRSVADIVNRNVLRAAPDATILHLSQLMSAARQSCVVVVETDSDKNSDSQTPEDIPIGIVTERDIVQFQILGLDLSNTSAQTVMSSPLVCVKPTDSLLEVQQQMKKLRVRRMVVTQSGKLQGIVALSEMLEVFNTTELYEVIDTLKDELDKQTEHLHQEIQQRQATENNLRENQQLLKLFVRHAPAAIAMVDSQMRYLIVSKRWLENYQLVEQDIIGQSHYDVFPELPERWQQNYQDILSGKVASLKSEEDTLERPDGTVEWLRWELLPWYDCQGEIGGLIMFYELITERKLLEQKLSWQATHDPLTGLYNRRRFEQELRRVIADANSNQTRHVLCYLDLDRFKAINDTCGHGAGDRLLQQLTGVLQQRIRSADIFARLGGDEFGILLHQCSLEVGSQIAEELKQLVRDFRFVWLEQTFSVGVSIGIVQIDSSTISLSSILNQADTACYTAKRSGRDRIFYQE